VIPREFTAGEQAVGEPAMFGCPKSTAVVSLNSILSTSSYSWFVHHEVLIMNALMTRSTNLSQHHEGTKSLVAPHHPHGGGDLLLSEKLFPTDTDLVDSLLDVCSPNRGPGPDASCSVRCNEEHTILESLHDLSHNDFTSCQPNWCLFYKVFAQGPWGALSTSNVECCEEVIIFSSLESNGFLDYECSTLELDHCAPFATSLFPHHADNCQSGLSDGKAQDIHNQVASAPPSYLPLLPSNPPNQIMMAVVMDEPQAHSSKYAWSHVLVAAAKNAIQTHVFKYNQSPVFQIDLFKVDGYTVGMTDGYMPMEINGYEKGLSASDNLLCHQVHCLIVYCLWNVDTTSI